MDNAILGKVAHQLESHLDVSGTWVSTLSTQSYDIPLKSDRLRYQRRLLDELFESSEADVAREGRSVLLTAGPPGAGKSTAIETGNLELDGWRIIDADDIKVRLLEDCWADGRFSPALDTILADGFPVRLNELSTLVHVESAILADRMAERSVEAGENVVISGTMSWAGTVAEKLRLLALHDYSDVRIIDVEVSSEVAVYRAYQRWARGRQAAAEGGDPRGGRFTPRSAIETLYGQDTSFSRCNENAVRFFNSDAAEAFDSIELLVSVGVGEPDVYRRSVGNYLTSIPCALNDRPSED
ncbi:zeta toxin family protein [Tersicoccus sp. Bi-70]|uniref:zeta toxin family protein n=1 Tax=Tersicoccus sp. Bi-70 TaxID=1897634 RepID=UPI000976EB71|nr:zeta toxin family protein [Tersicoccus sp. Bi-70]OMH34295.1 hypothetical protein BGP79_04060 [Tersicoccus sp. Bi-70]